MVSTIKAGYGALLAISAAFFIAALLLNLASLAGLVPAGSVSGREITLPMIALMAPMVLTSLRMDKDLPQRKRWKLMASFSPPWLLKVQYALGAYILGTWIFLAWKQYENASARADPTLFFSALGMALSIGVGMTAYAVFRDPTLLTGRSCRNGHRISPLDKFCPECGVEI